jgi:hypothetical protein
MVKLFEEVKDRFDPDGILNPGRIVRPPRMDDRRLLRYARTTACPTARWRSTGRRGPVRPAAVPGRRRDVQQQRRLPQARGGVMCPSYRATLDERDVTRGRANTLRLAISGQLGPDGLPPTRCWRR